MVYRDNDLLPLYFLFAIHNNQGCPIKHLPHLSTVNLPLVEFIHILTAFYHPPTSLVLITNSLMGASEYAQVGLNCTLN